MTKYFEQARQNEKTDNLSSALLFYLSSFCEDANNHLFDAGTVNKIRNLQVALGITDSDLCQMPCSYGSLSTDKCQQLLFFALHNDTEQMHRILEGPAYG